MQNQHCSQFLHTRQTIPACVKMLILSLSVPTSTVYMYYHLLKICPWAMNSSSSQKGGWVHFRELRYFSQNTSTSYAVSLALLCMHVALYPAASQKNGLRFHCLRMCDHPKKNLQSARFPLGTSWMLHPVGGATGVTLCHDGDTPSLK